jgi:hypothetical protein
MSTLRKLGIGLMCYTLGLVRSISLEAAELPPSEASSVPTQAVAEVGIYLNQIPEISLKENRLRVDFYIWFRWQGDHLKPLDSFEIVDGQIESREHVVEETLPGNVHYACCRIAATITKFWDVGRFPLDNHDLSILIEDGENEEFKLRYIADVGNCNVNESVKAAGWRLDRYSVKVVSETYRTNYGDTSLPTNNESVYSRFVFTIPMVRSGIGYFVKLFFGLFIATMIAILAFFIQPTDLDPRFGLGVGAIFAAVASEYVTTSSLPDTNVLTVADKMHIIAFGVIFLCLTESVISLWLFRSECDRKQCLSRRLDHFSAFVMTIAYASANCWVIWAPPY